MRARLSFQGLILAGCLLVVVCTLVFVGLVLRQSLHGQMVRQTTQSLAQRLMLLQEFLLDRQLPAASRYDSHNLAQELGTRLGVRLTLIDRQGRVLGDSQTPFEQLDSLSRFSNDPEVVQARTQGQGVQVRLNPSLGVEFLYMAQRLDHPDHVGLVARLALPLSQVDHALEKAQGLILGATLLGILLSIGVAYLVALVISKPLENLSKTASAIAAGDRSRRFRRYTSHEIGQLGRALDRMADNLETQILDMTKAKNRLETILKEMVEGVLVLDQEGRAMLSNQAFADMLDLPAAPGQGYIWQYVRHPVLLEALKEVRAGQPHQFRELRVLGPKTRYLDCHVVRLNQGEQAVGALAVLHDTTMAKRTDQMRRDFVANVSHELRTPLTAIRAAAETLQNGALDSPQYARHFAEVIERNCRRLERLTEDLLNLASLEGRQRHLELQQVQAAEFAEQTLGAVAELARQKDIDLDLHLEPTGFEFRAEPRQLEQAVVNLLENAIKYTPTGGQVRLELKRDRQHTTISVVDNGIGIGIEDQDRVFERFYRVDKNRSREMGGTGLGLSIVKHTAQLLGGRVELESALGRGSTFRLVIPT